MRRNSQLVDVTVSRLERNYVLPRAGGRLSPFHGRYVASARLNPPDVPLNEDAVRRQLDDSRDVHAYGHQNILGMV